jgi:hypothetical protein
LQSYEILEPFILNPDEIELVKELDEKENKK